MAKDKDFEVRHLASQKFVTILMGYSNVLDAKDAFARQKGHEDWGSWVAKYQKSRGTIRKPPYQFRRKS